MALCPKQKVKDNAKRTLLGEKNKEKEMHLYLEA